MRDLGFTISLKRSTQIFSYPQAAGRLPHLCTESGSKFRAFDDTSASYCRLMALPEACFKLLNRSLGSCATNSAILIGPPSSRSCRTNRAAFVV